MRDTRARRPRASRSAPSEEQPSGQSDDAPARRERGRRDDRPLAQAAGRHRREVRAAARGDHRQGERRGAVAVRGRAQGDPGPGGRHRSQQRRDRGHRDGRGRNGCPSRVARRRGLTGIERGDRDRPRPGGLRRASGRRDGGARLRSGPGREPCSRTACRRAARRRTGRTERGRRAERCRCSRRACRRSQRPDDAGGAPPPSGAQPRARADLGHRWWGPHHPRGCHRVRGGRADRHRSGDGRGPAADGSRGDPAVRRSRPAGIDGSPCGRTGPCNHRLPARCGRGPRSLDADAQGDRGPDDAVAPGAARVRPDGGRCHAPGQLRERTKRDYQAKEGSRSASSRSWSRRRPKR